MSRKTKISIIGFIIFAICVGWMARDSFEVTDPDNSRFNVEKFKFQNYETELLLHDALQKLFPAGTKREVVENILIDKSHLYAGYSKAENQSYNVTYFTHKDMPVNDKARMAQFTYNEKNEVSGIKIQFLGAKDVPDFFVGTRIQKGEKL